jgi:site-specific recombinase XerD
VLSVFNYYLEKHKINLGSVRIEHIDTFLAQFNKPYAPTTRRIYRSYLRGFLTYLYQHCGILHKDLAPLVVGAPLFAQPKPPKFLRPHEVKQLFDSLKLSSTKDLRNYAMVHLAYYLGLRPAEISLITLDDILFGKSELAVKNRKNTQEITLPLPENTLKAIVAYIVGARPKSHHRRLFLSLCAPCRPVSANIVGYYITVCIRQAGLSATAYWLRHTYAQNLLETGASIYEIKEMLGHDSIETSQKYLHIHVKLMRKVLFDEEL